VLDCGHDAGGRVFGRGDGRCGEEVAGGRGAGAVEDDGVALADFER